MVYMPVYSELNTAQNQPTQDRPKSFLGDFVMGNYIINRRWRSLLNLPRTQGAIREKWLQLGGTKSFLGLPTTNELTTPDKIGRYNHFKGGSIYWTPETNAHEIHGAIREKWAGLGWERSFLGYPITDELTTPDKIGRYNHFQNGSIYWTPDTNAHEVHGEIRRKWAELGWEKSFLGYPISDELIAPNNGRYSVFEEGVIKWDPITGARLARSFNVSSQTILNKIDDYILKSDSNLYLTGDTEVVKVHDWYKHDGQSHHKVLEVDLDMKYRRKGRDPKVDLDLFFSFSSWFAEIIGRMSNCDNGLR